MLAEEALARFPEKGDHETTAFPELAGEEAACVPAHGNVADGQHAQGAPPGDDYVAAHPEWLA